MSTAHILLVEDEPRIASVIKAYIEVRGWKCTHLLRGDDAWDWMELCNPILAPQVLLLDWQLPGLSGVALCSKVRALYPQLPIVMLTARVEEADRLQGFLHGADDYVCKPFSMEELMARIAVQLRKASAISSSSMGSQGDPIKLDSSGCLLSYAGKTLLLTMPESRIYQALKKASPSPVSRESLFMAAYSVGEDVQERMVDTHIKNLRKKLVQLDAPFTTIHTIYGLGYRMA